VALLLLTCWWLALWLLLLLLLLRVRSFRGWLLSLLLQVSIMVRQAQSQCDQNQSQCWPARQDALVTSCYTAGVSRKQVVEHSVNTAKLPAGKALQLAVGTRGSMALCAAHHCHSCFCSTQHCLLNASRFAPAGCSQHADVPASQSSSVVSHGV
jgi:hypothetical protein